VSFSGTKELALDNLSSICMREALSIPLEGFFEGLFIE
jgi:hypothetical protein